MKIAHTYTNMRAKLVLLLAAAAVLVVLSFLPNSRGTLASSEMRYSETSAHGLSIVPASCASYGAYYYHTALAPTATGYGYYLPPGASEYGAYANELGAYICVTNTSSNYYFIPANSANELNYFSTYPPPGVTVYK